MLSVVNISVYVDIVCECVVVCEMILVVNEIVEVGFDLQGCISEDLLDLVEFCVFKIVESCLNKDEGLKNIVDVFDVIVVCIEQLFQQLYDGVIGVNIGYDDFNKKIVGLQLLDLIIVVVCLLMGKIIFVMNFVENVVMLQDKLVFIFLLEMLLEQIMMCFLVLLLCVDQIKICIGQFDDEDWVCIFGIMGILFEKCNIYIDDFFGLMLMEVCFCVCCIVCEYGGIGFIMIDYL